MKVIEFKVFDELSKYKDSMLFDSGTIIATIECEHNNHIVQIDLRVCGHVKVYYKGDYYRYSSEFPEELKEIIRDNPNGWDYLNDDIGVCENNWFEYIFTESFEGRSYSDGIMFEDDLSKYSEEQLKQDMIDTCKSIAENDSVFI